MKKIITSFPAFFLSLLISLVLVIPSVHAAPSGLYLSPSNGTYETNTTFNVQLRLNESSSTGVQANMDFDRSKLAVTSTSNQGSAFTNTTTNYDNNAGTISVYAINGSGNGDRLITTITFKGIIAGNAPVNFARTNQTLGYILLVPIWSDVPVSNASYTIATPSTPSQTTTDTSTGSGTASTSPSAPTNPSSTPSTQTPKNSTSPTTPSTQPDSKKFKSANGLAEPYNTLPIPDDESITSAEGTNTPKSTFQYLPAAIASSLALVTAVIFIIYRRTHLSRSLRKLIAAIVLVPPKILDTPRLVQSALPGVSPIPVSLGTIRSAGRAMAPLAPKLLAFKSPKLLVSGIKKHLLITAGNDKNPIIKH